MKKLIVFIVLILWCVPAWGTVYVSTDWDEGTPASCWPCQQDTCSSSFDSWDDYTPAEQGGSGNACGLCGLDTSIYHTAPRSYRWIKGGSSSCPSNKQGSCTIYYTLSPARTHIFFRYYLYIDSTNMDAYGAISGSPLLHWMWNHTMAGNSSFQITFPGEEYWGGVGINDSIGVLPYGITSPYGSSGEWWDPRVDPTWDTDQTAPYTNAWATAPNHRSPDLTDELIDSWHCWEWELEKDANDHITATLWIDGDEWASAKGPGDTSDFDVIYLQLYDNINTNYEFKMYIDDIVISDTYNGPLGETTTTTAEPTTTTSEPTTTTSEPTTTTTEPTTTTTEPTTTTTAASTTTTTASAGGKVMIKQ